MRVGGVLIALLFGPGAAQAYHGRFWRGMRWALPFVAALVAALFTKYGVVAAAIVFAAAALDGMILSLVAPAGPRDWQSAIGFTGSYVALGIVAFLYAIQVVQVGSATMAPTIPLGGRVVIEKLTYRVKGPAVGDVVLFQPPCQSDREWLSRIVALANQTVEVRCGVLFVDGKAQPEAAPKPGRDRDFPSLETHAAPKCGTQPGDVAPAGELVGAISAVTPGAACAPQQHYTVPPGDVFVMGDHRDDANDSRIWGAVPVGNIRGRLAWQVHW